jgi:hypothetical protein
LKNYLKQYIKNILIWLDQGVNVVLLAGNPDETLSSKAAKYADKGFILPEKIIDFFFWKGHCQASREDDRDDNIKVSKNKKPLFICGFLFLLFILWSLVM